jgi:hypothetical protein
MKRIFAIAAALVVTGASLAWAQTTQSKPLAEVAKAEEARRKEVKKKPAKVFTNGSLKPDVTGGAAQPVSTPTPDASAPSGTPADATPEKPEPGSAKDQAFWAGRMKSAREQLQRTQLFADSLQTRINSLTTDIVNRDDPAQRAKLETDRQAALAELERLKKEITDQTKAIAAIEEEARRAGVPVGWLRPGA